MGGITLGVIWWGTDQFGDVVGRTMGLTVFSILNVAFAWATKDEMRSLLDTDVSGDRYLVRIHPALIAVFVLATELGPLQRLLGTVSLTFDQWVIAGAAGPVDRCSSSEIKKRVWRVDLDVPDAPVEPVRPGRPRGTRRLTLEVPPMADQRFKRIHEFIEPFRVEPGRKVRLPRDFDPGYTGDPGQEGGRRRAARGGREAALPSTRSGSPRRTPGRCWSSSRRWTPPARTAPSAT